MRIPLRKLHRAFPELDQFSDRECRGMIHRVIMRNLLVTIGVSVAAFAGCVVIFLAITITGVVLAGRYLAPARRDDIIGLTILVAAVCGLIAAFLIRDLFVRRTINSWILSARCQLCPYSLIGLRAVGHIITCPECGCANDLRARGLDPETLVPRTSG